MEYQQLTHKQDSFSFADVLRYNLIVRKSLSLFIPFQYGQYSKFDTCPLYSVQYAGE